MKHRALTRLIAALLCLLLSGQAFAAETVDVQSACSLTLHYTQGETGLSGEQIALWQVGEVYADGTYALTAPYPVEIQGITAETEWRATAATLSAYLTADAVQPDYLATTDETGTAVFAELPVGLYLIRGLTVATDAGNSIFEDFFLFLPRNTGGSYAYSVEAVPKHATFVPKAEELEYSVLKLWKDAGAAAQRPEQIHVDILQDGQLWESVTLSAENSWRYSWNAPAGQDFAVVERQVPAGYTVTVTETETAFVLTNTAPPDTDNPQTGDTAPITLYILLLSLSGLGLVLLGIRALRRKSHDESR